MRARASAPPSSRSTTQTAFRTSRPASRTAVDGLLQGAAGGDDVLDQAHELPRLEGALEPVAVPYSFADSRTIRNGSPEASDADAASATAPTAGRGEANGAGSCSRTAAASRSPSGPSSSGRVSKRYLSR